MQKNLQVYKSSAGSGKTFTLVRFYLQLALKGNTDYRHILAGRITNIIINTMKKNLRSIFVFHLLMSSVLYSYSQYSISNAYNSTMAGRSYIITCTREVSKKIDIGVGLRYNINSLEHPDDQNKVYYKRLFATKPLQHLGVNIFVNYNILPKFEHIKTFIFYDAQATYSTTRNRMYLPYAYDNEGNVLYKEYLEYFGPFTWIEQNFGIGFHSFIYKNLFMYERIGGGISFIIGYEKKLASKFAWEFGPLVQVGLGYRISTKN